MSLLKQQLTTKGFISMTHYFFSETIAPYQLYPNALGRTCIATTSRDWGPCRRGHSLFAIGNPEVGKSSNHICHSLGIFQPWSWLPKGIKAIGKQKTEVRTFNGSILLQENFKSGFQYGMSRDFSWKDAWNVDLYGPNFWSYWAHHFNHRTVGRPGSSADMMGILSGGAIQWSSPQRPYGHPPKCFRFVIFLHSTIYSDHS